MTDEHKMCFLQLTQLHGGDPDGILFICSSISYSSNLISFYESEDDCFKTPQNILISIFCHSGSIPLTLLMSPLF